MAPDCTGSARSRRVYSKRFGAAAAGLAACLLTGGPGSADPLGPPIPFPTGYDYPASSSLLQEWIKRDDESALRRHSWYLWAGINQPGRDRWPIWASWNTATQVFAPTQKLLAQNPDAAIQNLSLATINKRNRASAPINLSSPYYIGSNLPDGQIFQNNGDIMLVTEAYTQAGYEWIRKFKLFERKTLETLHLSGRSDIPAMPSTSIVLKHMYWPVKKDGLTALPVVDMSTYDKSADPVTTYVGYENQQRWSRAVAIDPSRAIVPPAETASVTYLYNVLKFAPGTSAVAPPPLGPLTYPKAKVVPLSDFYFKKLSIAEFRAMSAADQKLINASFYWAHKRNFEDGDYLVAIACHIVTKETPDWTLQTLWWSDEPDATKYAKDRPVIPNAAGPWRHYLLATEDGTSKGDTVPIAYNPYIELAAAHPVATNCRNCHMRADLPKPQYLTANGKPDALANLKFSDPIFKDKLRTDFLWTIVDRAIPVPKQE